MAEHKYNFDRVSIRIVKEQPLIADINISTPERAISLVGELLCDLDREALCVININTQGRPVNCNIVTIGTVNMTVASPRDILKSSILSNASSIIAVHNHPSGLAFPSQVDYEFTEKMKAACEIMDITFSDHVIVAGDNKVYFSFAQNGVLKNKQQCFRYLRENTDVDERIQYGCDAKSYSPDDFVSKGHLAKACEQYKQKPKLYVAKNTEDSLVEQSECEQKRRSR